MLRIVIVLYLGLCSALLNAASPADARHSEKISGHSSLSRTAETPPAYPNALTVVAAALGVSPQIAIDARAQNFPEALSWVIMLMAKRCACPVSNLMGKRKSMNWGEVADSAGYVWVELLEEARLLSEAAGIQPGLSTMEQLYRSIRNDPGPSGLTAEVLP